MLNHFKTVVAVVAVGFALSTAAVQADSGAPVQKSRAHWGKWWQHPRTVKSLNLTQTEIDSLDAAFDARARKFIALKHTIELAQFDLDQTMGREPLDETALMAQFNKLESARSNLSKERFQYYVQVRKLLGAERFQKIEAFRKRMHLTDRENRRQRKKMQP